MSDNEKIEEIRTYLQSEFPDYTIENRYDSDRQAHRFQINRESNTYLAIISDEFIDDHDVLDIGVTIRTFLLAEHLREITYAAVVVTNAGLELEEG